LATNHSSIANMLFYFDPSIVLEPLSPKYLETKIDKGKEKIGDGDNSLKPLGNTDNVPLILFLKLLNRPLFLHSTTHLEQV
jgi:E3 ubiquitin-protein ligase HUWE1